MIVKCMKFIQKIDLIKAILVIVSASFIVSVMYLSAANSKIVTIQEETEEITKIIIKEDIQFSEENLKNLLLELNVKFPHIILAQAKLESGNFKSHMFIENNNIFGMKEAKKRPTTNKGTQNGHAYYENWKDCVIDYAFYQAAYLNDIKTEEQYYQYLAGSYAKDPGYIAKVKVIANSLKINI
jgi:uncharacterized FlgJ-related protein